MNTLNKTDNVPHMFCALLVMMIVIESTRLKLCDALSGARLTKT